MTNSITNRQMILMVVLILCGFGVTLSPKIMAQSSGTGAWVTILLTSLLFGLSLAMVASLNARFPGKILLDYSGELMGKFFSYAFSAVFLVIVFGYLVFLITQMGGLLQADFFPKTPKWVMMFIAIPVFCAVAYRGVTNVARMAEIIGIIYLIFGTIVHLLMLTQSRITNILPLFDSAETLKYIVSIKEAGILFVGGSILYITPFTTKENGGKKAVRAAFFTMILTGLFYAWSTETSIAKIGLNNIVHYKDALIVAIRDFEIPFLDFFKRMDFLYLTVGFMGYFMAISMVFLGFIETFNKLFKGNRLINTCIAGALSYVACLMMEGVSGFEDFVIAGMIYVWIIVGTIIPLTLLIVAKAKKIKLPPDEKKK
jgi:spore germination protein (amino acid permease)